MADKTATRVDLTEAVYRAVGLSRTESASLVDSFFREITESLVKRDNVMISSFGSFIVRDKTQRIGRNPRTGVEVPIAARTVLVFKPSNVLKRQVSTKLTESDNASE